MYDCSVRSDVIRSTHILSRRAGLRVMAKHLSDEKLKSDDDVLLIKRVRALLSIEGFIANVEDYLIKSATYEAVILIA